MNKTLLFICIAFFSITSIFGQNQYWQWAKSAGGIIDENGTSTATDAAGNVYVAGTFSSSSITFGTNAPLINNGYTNVFIVKYNSSGIPQWSRSFGGLVYESCNGIAVDASGNVYFCGSFSSPSIVFNTSTITNVGFNDVYIAKYSPTGNPVWARAGVGDDDDNTNGISLDNFGNIYFTGSFKSTSLSFDGNLVYNYSPGITDMFVAKYDLNGNFIWAKSKGEEGYDSGKSVATDNNGNVYIAGSFTSVKFQIMNTPIFNPGGSSIFVIKYDSTGYLLWISAIGGAANEEGAEIIVDNLGYAYVTGTFFSSFMFGSTNMISNGNSDIFVGKLNTTTASPIWGKSGGGTSWDMGYSLILDNSNNLYASGRISSSEAYFGNDTLINSSTEAVYVTKYNYLTGNEIWVKGIQNSGSGFHMSSDNAGNIYHTGYFTSTTNVGSTVLNSAGATDIFVAKIAQCNIPQPVITPNGLTTFCPGGSVILNSSPAASYLWSNGATTQSINASTTNNYSVTITDINGCQNTNSITVTALQPYAYEVICEVNIDTALNKNFVVWEKTPNVGIATYKIYKESVAGGVYTSIGTSPFDSLSVFYDAGSNPTVKSDRYKISVIDTCGNESATLSPAHKTLHLTVNQGMGNTINLIWENYEGFVFSSYYIYRGLSPSTLLPLDTIPNTITTYTDNTAPVGTFNYYQIVIAKPDSCVATKNSKTQTTQTFNTSVSNMEEYKIIGIDEIGKPNFGLNAFPNPFANESKIEYYLSNNAKVKLSLYNVYGEQVMDLSDKNESIGNHLIYLNSPNLNSGIYFLNLSVNGNSQVIKIVKI